MCHATIFHYSCGCTQEVRKFRCALPSEACTRSLRNSPHQNAVDPCPDHRRAQGRSSPSQYIHPAFRNDGPSATVILPNPPARSNNAVQMANRPMRTRQSPSAPPTAYRDSRRKRSTGGSARSPAAGLSATMRNPAHDLNMMPATFDTSTTSPTTIRGNLRNISEIPHIPQLPLSPPRRHHQTRRPSASPIGVTKQQQHQRRRPSRARVSPSPVSPLNSNDCKYINNYGRTNTNNSGRHGSINTTNTHGNRKGSTNNYSEAQKAANLQRQLEVRRRREVYEECTQLIASRRYTKDQLMRHHLVMQLPDRDRESLFYEHDARLRDAGKYDEYRHQRTKKSRCVVM